VPEIGAVGRRDVVAKPADGAGAAAEKEPAPGKTALREAFCAI
jgi:hypothetical protein